MSDDEEVYLESFGGDGVDYSDKFYTQEKFDSRKDVWDWCKDIALNNGFNLIKASNKRISKNSALHYLVYDCERGGSYKGLLKNPLDILRKNTTTKKCQCKFKLKAVEDIVDVLGDDGLMIKKHVWVVHVMHGFHNHALTVYADGHRRRSSFTEDERSYIRQQVMAQVKPAKISHGLHIISPDKPRPVIKQIYNEGSKIRKEEMGGRNPAQQMLYLANQNGYAIHWETDDNGKLTDIFLAHPEAIALFHAYPYVVLIDSTYKTNKYKLPLVEIVGVTPVGKSFLIAYAIMQGEASECYQWMLMKLKTLMLDGIVPNVFVTDRELGLIAAVEMLFPYSAHLLCVWHVNCAVENKAIHTLRNAQLGRKIVKTEWGWVVYSESDEDLGRAWERLEVKWPMLKEYLRGQWLPNVHKFVKCYSNMFLHFGNTATSRVESAHAVLKDWLDSSTLSLDSVWTRIHGLIKAQHVEIRSLLEKSRSRELTSPGRLFTLLSGFVSTKAIILLQDEFKRGITLGIGLNTRCGCALNSSHGLPCACRLHMLYAEGRRVHLEDVHVFWRTLAYGFTSVMPPDDLARLEEAFKQIRDGDSILQQRVLEALQTELHPEDEDIEEPAVKMNPKGRPKRGTTRNKSAVEHARRKHDSSKSSQSLPCTSTSTNTSFAELPSGPLQQNYDDDVARFPYNNLIPSVISHFFDAWYNPIGDGNCGFRAISHAYRGNENHYLAMRRLLLGELADPRYTSIYGTDELALVAARARVDFMHLTSCGEAHYMCGWDNFGYASLFNWTICVIGSRVPAGRRRRVWDGCSTFLPLRTSPGVHEPFGVLWLLHTGNHWVRLHIEDGAPMPPIHPMWYMSRTPEVVHYEGLYQANIAAWKDVMCE